MFNEQVRTKSGHSLSNDKILHKPEMYAYKLKAHHLPKLNKNSTFNTGFINMKNTD